MASPPPPSTGPLAVDPFAARSLIEVPFESDQQRAAQWVRQSAPRLLASLPATLAAPPPAATASAAATAASASSAAASAASAFASSSAVVRTSIPSGEAASAPHKVNQLDALQLDEELASMLRFQVRVLIMNIHWHLRYETHPACCHHISSLPISSPGHEHLQVRARRCHRSVSTRARRHSAVPHLVVFGRRQCAVARRSAAERAVSERSRMYVSEYIRQYRVYDVDYHLNFLWNPQFYSSSSDSTYLLPLCTDFPSFPHGDYLHPHPSIAPAAARPASTAVSNLSFAQRFAHGALSIGARWAWQRFGAFMTDAAWSSRPDVVVPVQQPQPVSESNDPAEEGGDLVIVDGSESGSGIVPRRTMDWRRRVYVLSRRLEALYRAASIANFLAFLYNGRYACRARSFLFCRVYVIPTPQHASLNRHALIFIFYFASILFTYTQYLHFFCLKQLPKSCWSTVGHAAALYQSENESPSQFRVYEPTGAYFLPLPRQTEPRMEF
jgi:hypothetical protein